MSKELEHSNTIAQACMTKREAMQLSCEELAEKVGCVRTTIWKFENGSLWPKRELLVKILEVLELEITLIDKKN